jgi:hypothetical protein
MHQYALASTAPISITTGNSSATAGSHWGT